MTRTFYFYIELLVIGSLFLWVSDFFYPISDIISHGLGSNAAIEFLSFCVLAWISGYFINALADFGFTAFYQFIVNQWLHKHGDPSLVLDKLRYQLYLSSSSIEIIQRIEYYRSFIRISRSLILINSLLIIMLLFSQKTLLPLLFVLVAVVIISLISYIRSVNWYIKTIYYAWNTWSATKKNSQDAAPSLLKYQTSQTALAGTQVLNNKNIVAFSGGTGFRDINMSLAALNCQITRIVPIWDNGGSSEVLRDNFKVMPVGDIRHALMTQAHGEGRVGAIVKLFNWRLPAVCNQDLLSHELNKIISGQHPLILGVDQNLREVILTYLKQFQDKLNPDMKLNNGSIGNFVLLGAYLAHNKDINTAIYVFRQLCSIQGNVWPISLNNDLHINACLENNEQIFGQANLTKLDREKNQTRIKQIYFDIDTGKDSRPDNQKKAQVNKTTIDILDKAEVIVYGPGSFFTSVLPHIMVEEVAEKISSLNIPKIFVGNLLEDNESYGYCLKELLDIFITTANRYTRLEKPASSFISHVLVNKTHGMNEYKPNNRHYLNPGDGLEVFTDQGISIIINDFENPWKRGSHDPDLLAQTILKLE